MRLMLLRRRVGGFLRRLLIDDEDDRQHKSGDAKQPGEAPALAPLLWRDVDLVRRRGGL
jgi:hypothetical protein